MTEEVKVIYLVEVQKYNIYYYKMYVKVGIGDFH